MPNEQDATGREERWAHFRFSVIGPLLAAPPDRGELREELEILARKKWRENPLAEIEFPARAVNLPPSITLARLPVFGNPSPPSFYYVLVLVVGFKTIRDK